MDPLELALMQMGIPPEQRQAMLRYILASQQPPMDPFIGASGYDVKDANKYVDYGKDVNSLMADNMTAANAGMGAYGGANEIGFQAFDPVMSQPKPVAGPDRQLLDRYLSRPTTDAGGWIADQIANQGATAFEIVGQINNLISRDWEDPELQARKSQFLQLVPQYTDPASGQPRFDMSGVERLANTLEEQSVAQPVPGSFQDKQGNWWTQDQTDSPQTEWYRKQGLPLPTQTYTLDDFTPEGAQYRALSDTQQQAYDAQAPVRQAMDKNMQQAYQTLMLTRDRAAQEQQRQAAASAAPKALSPNAAEYTAFLNQQKQGSPNPPGGFDWQGALANTNADRTAQGLPQLSMQLSGQQTPLPPVATAPTAGNTYLADQQGNGTSLTDIIRNPMGFIHDQQMRQQFNQAQQNDPDRTKTAMKNYLDAARARSQMNQGALDAYLNGQRAQGRRFWDPKTNSYEADRGVAQGNLDYALAKAQGRTPLQDALRARAMAAFMMGG